MFVFICINSCFKFTKLTYSKIHTYGVLFYDMLSYSNQYNQDNEQLHHPQEINLSS